MNDPSSSSGTYEPGHPTQPGSDPAPQAQSPWQPPPAAPRRSNRVQWIAAAVLLVLILGGVWFFRDRLPGSAADLAVGVPAFESYTGRPVKDETEYDVGAFYPARSSWNDGDREVTCYAYRVDGEKLTDSIRSN